MRTGITSIDAVIIVLYLVAVLGLGVYCVQITADGRMMNISRTPARGKVR